MPEESPICELQTSRCLLRGVKASDSSTLSQLWLNREVRQYLGGTVPPDSALERAVALVNRPNTWAVCKLAEGDVMGMVTLGPREGKTELSYMFLPNFWGHGYAYEACQAVLAYAFGELNLDEVIAVTQAANLKSCRLLERLGMVPTVTFTEFEAEQVEYRQEKPR